MPTYEYRCERGHEFEVEQRITDAPLEMCHREDTSDLFDSRPCLAPAKRLISRGTSFRLEGGGWASSGYSS